LTTNITAFSTQAISPAIDLGRNYGHADNTFKQASREIVVQDRKRLYSQCLNKADLTRRGLICSAAAAGAAAVVGPGFAQGGATLSFGLTPVFLTNDLDLLTNLRTYLEEATGYDVQLVQRRTYQEITSMLVSGQVDAAWICGFPFVAYRKELELVAVPVWRGKPEYQAYLIAAHDRQADGIDDLRGDIHAFSDPDSNSGYLVTSALLADRGQRPSDFFARTFFTYGHRNVVRAVAAGLAESGSVDGYVWEVMSKLEPGLTDRTRVVRQSEWLGFPPVATARSHAERPEVRALANALIAMPESELGRSVLQLLRLDGFVRASPSQYDTIAMKMDKVRSLE